MLRGCILITLLSILAGVEARAQGACPWLTQGTAEALMGGEVSVTVRVSDGVGTCEFMHKANSGESKNSPDDSLMKITVSHQPTKVCVSGDRLVGVGQDALLCRIDAEGEHRESISGRVRANFFVLSLTSSANNRPALEKSLEQAAEEVAGSLF